MKILITGYTGFVGKYLVNYFDKEGFEVEGVSLRSTNINFAEKCTKGSVIIHLAGKAHDLKKVGSVKEYLETNFELTKQVYDAFSISKSETFIYFSSIKAVADNFEGKLSENTPESPLTIYGQSKLMAEKYIMKNGIIPGKRVFILRPCMIHGPGNKGNLNLLLKFLKYRIPYPLGSYRNKRSFLYIGNLAFVLKEFILNNKIKSGTYNVSDEESLSTYKLVKLISEVLNKKFLVLNINKHFVNFLAKMGDLFGLPFNSESLGKLIENFEVDSTKLIKSVRKPMPFTSEEGLKLTIKSLSSELV
jgi:nucleoside-diphosphate-sugar epimerase